MVSTAANNSCQGSCACPCRMTCPGFFRSDQARLSCRSRSCKRSAREPRYRHHTFSYSVPWKERAVLASEQALVWLVQAPALEQTVLQRNSLVEERSLGQLRRLQMASRVGPGIQHPKRLHPVGLGDFSDNRSRREPNELGPYGTGRSIPPPPPWPKRPKCEHMQAGMTNSTRRFGRHLPSVQLDPGTKLSSLVSTAASPSSSCSLCDSKVISRALLEM